MTALPRDLAAAQRRLDADHCIDAGEDIGEGDADLLRLAGRVAGQVHDAAHALDHEIVAGAARIGAILPETGNRASHDAWIDSRQAGVIEAVFLEAADLEIL